jgi:hypothetical protein
MVLLPKIIGLLLLVFPADGGVSTLVEDWTMN